MTRTATKKPVTIEFIEWTGENISEIYDFCDYCAALVNTCDSGEQLVIETLEGGMIATVDSMIIKGVKGEFYPCKPDIFKLTYDEV